MKEKGISRKQAVILAEKPKVRPSLFNKITSDLKERID